MQQNAVTKEITLLPDLTLNLGDGVETFLSATISGPILVTPQGVALDITASLRLGTALATRLAGKLSFGPTGAISVRVRVNTGSAPVDRTSPAINVPAGPYVEISTPAGTPVTLIVMGQQLSGEFRFTQATVGGAKVVRIALSNVSMFLGIPGTNPNDPAASGGLGLVVSAGQGGFLLTPGGLAGTFAADVSLSAALLAQLGGGVSARVGIAVNTVPATTTVPDGTGTVTLPRGPYLKATVTGLVISFGNLVGGNREYRIVGSFQFEKGRVGTADVLTIAMAGVALEKWNTTAAAYQAIGLDDIQGVLLVNPRGSSGVALTLSGLLRASGNGFTAGGRLGVVLNTSTADLSGTNAVDVDVNGTIVRLTAGAGATGAPYFAVNASDVSFDFGGLLEISGDFSIDSNGSFRGSNLTVFVGKGPSTDPGAIGLKITNASVEFHRFADGTFVLIVGGGVALVGLDGLRVSGTVDFQVNTGTTDCSGLVPTGTDPCGGVRPVSAQSWRLDVSGLHLGVAGVLDISGLLSVGRQPNGTLDLAIANAKVLVALGGKGVIELTGNAAFSISPLTGFRLSNFKVQDFTLFPTSVPTDFVTVPTTAGSGTTTPATRFPTADLAFPFNGGMVTATQLGTGGGTACGNQTCVQVVYNDVNKVGLNTASILDAAPEFEVLFNGSPVTGLVIGNAVLVPGKVNTYAYRITGLPSIAGVVEIRFLNGAFSDATGIGSTAETERFFQVAVVSGQIVKPGPVATLASPSNGETLSAADLNARRYIDVTYTSQDGKPVERASIEDGAAEFTLSGTGVLDVMRDATGAPVVVGVPLLIAGLGADATSRTYRYFLKDRNTGNTVDLFGAGDVLLTFVDQRLRDVTTEPPRGRRTSRCSRRASRSTRRCPGADGGRRIKLGPLSLQGPTIGIADVGLLRRHAGADHRHRRQPGLPRLRRRRPGGQRHPAGADGADRTDPAEPFRRDRRPDRPARAPSTSRSTPSPC